MSKLNSLYKFLRYAESQDRTAFFLDNSEVTIAHNATGVLVHLRNYPDVGWRVVSSLYRHEFFDIVGPL